MKAVHSPTEPTLFRPDDILAQRGKSPWLEPLFGDGRNEVVLICDAPGSTTSTASVDPDYNEFWFVLRGEYEWLIGDHAPISAAKGDIVMRPAAVGHTINVVGDEPGLRIAVYGPDGATTNGSDEDITKVSSKTEPPNMLLTPTSSLLANSDDRRFTIIEDDRNTVYLIREYPGTVSKAHWHFDFDEWWFIAGGELVFEVGEGRPKIQAKDGDIVFTPRGFRHQIRTIGDQPSLRMPVTTADNVHIWTDDDTTAPPSRA
jgi:mannose-6-phosphate isomerase-like protein (cupin superfamily)